MIRKDMIKILVDEERLNKDHLKGKTFKEIEKLFDKRLAKRRFDL